MPWCQHAPEQAERDVGAAADLTYLNDIPYCDTCSKPVFQTRVTSQALVACNRHDKKAETGFPPTTTTFISSYSSDMIRSPNGEGAYGGRQSSRP